MMERFETLSLVYANLRGIMKTMEEETGAKLVITLSSDEDFDEGILVLRGMDKLIEKYGVKDTDISLTPGGVYKKAGFTLFGIKFSGYVEESLEKEAGYEQAV